MARSVTFNGITQFRPGGISRVDAGALAQLGLSTNGIIGLVGEADGGEPLSIIEIDDPALAKSAFRSGPLANAIRLAFDPSDDPRVPGGAFRCLCVKTNQSTQSTLILYQEVGSDTATGTPTTTNVPVTDAVYTVDEHVGSLLRVTFASGLVESRPITANDDGQPLGFTVSPAFSVAPVATDTVEILAPQFTLTSRDYGIHTAQILFEFEQGVNFGSHWTTTLDGKSQPSGDIAGRSFIEVEYVGNSQQFEHITGTAEAASTTTVITEVGNFTGLTLDDYFVFVDIAGTPTNYALRRIASHTDDALTLDNAMLAEADSSGYSVRTGEILSFGPDATAGVNDVVAPITAWSANTITIPVAAGELDIFANELTDMMLVIVGGTGEGQRRAITSNTASIITIDEDWITQPDATSDFQIWYTELADATVVGAAGVATSFTSRVQENGALTPVADLNLTITATTTLSDLVAAIDADPSYDAFVASGVDGTILASTLDYGGPEAAGVAVAGNAQYVDLRNDRDAVVTPPSGGTDPVAQWPNHFRRDLELIVENINSVSEQLTVTRSTGSGTGSGSSRPEFQTGSAGTTGETTGEYLSGGARGISNNTNWQSAFDLLLQRRRQSVVALIAQDQGALGFGSTATYASVAAQLASHVSQGVGIEKNEGGGYIGFDGTLTELTDRANVFNNPDVQVCAQTQDVLDVDGNLVTLPEWASAVIAAGMRAGMPEVGEPLTHKFFRTAAMDQDASWDPLERTDANLLIQNGVLFAETIRGKGTRWVRDLTTYIQDDNLAFMEGSVRDVVRFVSYELRTFLEDRFTGIKASPATATSIKESTSALLEVMRSDNIIVDSTDSDGNVVRAYHNLRVTISGDIATVRVSIFPVVGINFQLTEIFLQLPTQSA
jgi:hypothetical protein